MDSSDKAQKGIILFALNVFGFNLGSNLSPRSNRNFRLTYYSPKIILTLMADSTDAGGTKQNSDKSIRHITPNAGWTEDQERHNLLLNLPDFKRQEIKFEIDEPDHITISGERQVSEGRSVRFKKTYKVPENSEIKEAGATLREGIFIVDIPKKETKTGERAMAAVTFKEDIEEKDMHQKGGDKKQDHNKKECSGSELMKKGGKKNLNPFGNTIQLLLENMGIIIPVVLAFSLGVLVSPKLRQ